MRTYSYLGPAGTFTEAALRMFDESRGQRWIPVDQAAQTIQDVSSGRSDAGVVALESSVDGGVAIVLDELARTPRVRIVGEVLVPVAFVLVALPGTKLEDVRVVTAHPVAYAQCSRWITHNLPNAEYLPANSNVAAAASLVSAGDSLAAIAPPTILNRYDLAELARDLGNVSNAITRFVMLKRNPPLPERTGRDRTTIVVESVMSRPGALVQVLREFSTRGVGLAAIQSRPSGTELGHYRFTLDLVGHVQDRAVRDALEAVLCLAVHMRFLGSYPDASGASSELCGHYSDRSFEAADSWASRTWHNPV